MSEKRFTIQDERVIKDNQKYITETGYVFSYNSDAEEVCDLLNKFYEDKLQYEILVDELKRQNAKLKSRLNDLGVEYYE